MSDDIIITNTLPPGIVALQHSTLAKAMDLCARAHEIVIPSAKLDEQGCLTKYNEANALYKLINGLSKDLEQDRLARGREIQAIKDQVTEAFNAGIKPLEDQRARLGLKVDKAKRELDAVHAEKVRRAEEEARRIEAERRAEVERTRLAAEKAQREAAAAERAAAEAQRKADEQAAAAAAVGDDPMPDDGAETARLAAEEAKRKADEATAAAFKPVFEPVARAYVAPVPKSSVRSNTKPTLVIDDISLVPDEVGGKSLWKRSLDEEAALNLIVAGLTIPGLHREDVVSVGAKGRSTAFEV